MTKGLEALKDLRLVINDHSLERERLDIIENELKNGEKYKKAFELLKKKYGFRVYEHRDFEGNGFKGLTTHFRYDGFFTLPQDEYDLLKEVLRNE